MRYVLAGGTGFLGRALGHQLAIQGHDVVVLSRRPDASAGQTRIVSWPDGTDWQREIDGAEGVINMAGAGIADRRWSPARKQVLRHSRVDATRALVGAMRDATVKPKVFVSGSAVGFYGPQPDDGPALDESAPPGSDFLSTLGVDWEAEAHPASALGIRVVLLRTGVVLDRRGGALQKMIPPFAWWVGGPLGSGRQVVSWIHLTDWVELVLWLLRRPDAAGVFNATAPEPATNREFSAALGAALGRPSWIAVPGIALRLLVGEMAGPALLAGQRVVPRRALEMGFQFRYPEIRSAMKAAV